MAEQTSTIWVPTATCKRLRALSERSGEPAGEIVAKLVDAADEDALLSRAVDAFDRLARDPVALAAYRSEVRELDAGFGSPAPA